MLMYSYAKCDYDFLQHHKAQTNQYKSNIYQTKISRDSLAFPTTVGRPRSFDKWPKGSPRARLTYFPPFALAIFVLHATCTTDISWKIALKREVRFTILVRIAKRWVSISIALAFSNYHLFHLFLLVRNYLSRSCIGTANSVTYVRTYVHILLIIICTDELNSATTYLLQFQCSYFRLITLGSRVLSHLFITIQSIFFIS